MKAVVLLTSALVVEKEGAASRWEAAHVMRCVRGKLSTRVAYSPVGPRQGVQRVELLRIYDRSSRLRLALEAAASSV